MYVGVIWGPDSEFDNHFEEKKFLKGPSGNSYGAESLPQEPFANGADPF